MSDGGESFRRGPTHRRNVVDGVVEARCILRGSESGVLGDVSAFDRRLLDGVLENRRVSDRHMWVFGGKTEVIGIVDLADVSGDSAWEFSRRRCRNPSLSCPTDQYRYGRNDCAVGCERGPSARTV